MSKLEIEEWEDRSYQAKDGEAVHNGNSFGFIYFNDGSRVGYSPGVRDHAEVWEPRTNGGGEFVPVTDEHLRMARELLKKKGILP